MSLVSANDQIVHKFMGAKSNCNGGNFNLIASHGLDAAGVFDTL